MPPRRVGRPRISRLRPRRVIGGRRRTVRRLAPRRKIGGRRRVIGRRRMRGRGFFSNIGNWFKGAANTVHNFVRNNKLVSKGLALLPHPAAKAAGVAAGLAGYGRRRKRLVKRRAVGGRRIVRRRIKRRVGGRRIVRRRIKRRVGGSFRSVLSKAHSFIKSNRLVSRGLNHFGHSKLSNAARSMGYGRRRTVRRRRGGSLRGVLSKAHSFIKSNRLVSRGLSHFGHSKLSNAARSLGYGRRRRTRRRGGSNNPLFNMLYKGVLPAARTIAKKLGYGRRRRN